jgi:hypothetical protein
MDMENKPDPKWPSDHDKNQEKQGSKNEWSDLPTDTTIRLLNEFEKYADDDYEIKKVPELLYLNGKLNKDLFGAILMYAAPQYFLFNSNGAKEALGFLEDLNKQLVDTELSETIVFLQTQISYLEASNEVSNKAFANLDAIVEKARSSVHWFKHLDEQIKANDIGQKALLLRVKVEGLFTKMINNTYDGLWDKYLVNDFERKERKALPGENRA